MKAYVCGPMTGYEFFNLPLFFAAEAELSDFCSIVNPGKNAGGETWYEAYEEHLKNPRSWEWYLKIDLKSMLDCDRVYTLPGWTESKGAQLEVYVAERVGIAVFHNRFDHLAGKKLTDV